MFAEVVSDKNFLLFNGDLLKDILLHCYKNALTKYIP